VQLTPLSTHWARRKKNKKRVQSFSDTVYFTHIAKWFQGLLIGVIPKGKWLECEADCLSVCAKVNAWLSSVP